MKKCIINSLIFFVVLGVASVSSAVTFLCPTLKANELYYYFDWIDTHGNKYYHGEWNQQKWRIWINGDSYFTPQFEEVTTTPLAVHYFASTNTWYLKCISGDLSIGPRNNVWTYSKCEINQDHTGFDCNS